MSRDVSVEGTRDLARQIRAAAVIVIGLDGSSTSWDAFSWAAGEVLRAGGQLVAVHVMPLAEPVAGFGVPYDYAGVRQARLAVADELKDEAVRQVRRLGISMVFLSEYGDVTTVLTAVSRRVHASLIVVGRSTKALHHLAGSLSHRLTSRNDAPVVVVVP
jgi:nucleotide-binding universal stress UspA family protein